MAWRILQGRAIVTLGPRTVTPTSCADLRATSCVWNGEVVSGPEVRLIAGPREWRLETVPRTVPAGPLVLSVSGTRSRTVLLDGRATRLSSGPEGLVAIDLTRSTGYHRLDIDGIVFWFGTEDAKLGLVGVEAMLKHLRTLGTGWTGQALFSDGSRMRDVHVLYAWLDQWADIALAAVHAILASPRPAIRSAQMLSRRGGRPVLLSQTLRLVRSAPRQYLTVNDSGLIPVGNTAYDPLRVVVRRRTTTLDTVANRRAVGLLGWLFKLCQEVLASQPDQSAMVRCQLWLNRAQTLQQRPLAQALRATMATSSLVRQAEEATEARYRRSYEIVRDLRRKFGWSADCVPLPRFSYVERADSIYQAYAASCLASALGLTQTSDVLGTAPLAFTGPRFDLYYDALCPPHVLRSWRASSICPDMSRPDLLLHERDSGRVAVLDAKYRIGRDGAASEDSRKEVSAYMSLYGLNGITIIFPGIGCEPRAVVGHGRRIVELPLAPPAVEFAAAIPKVLETLQRPQF